MSKKKQEIKDTKTIEEKALNYFKAFIEDSKVISQFLSEDDKEPCWDGHLYLYSDGNRDKEHLLGRVPVQIKGTEVDSFDTKQMKFKLEKTDLNAYLREPTFFIVCQIKKDSKERKLFYLELLPDLVKRLLQDMDRQKSIKTMFSPLTEDLTELEDQLRIFMSNSKMMISFAQAKPFSMADAVEKGIKEFSFVAPSRFTELKQLFKYLSTHETYFYAKVLKEFDVDIPLSDGPARLAFKMKGDGNVKVGNKVFYKGYTSEVKDGRMVVTIANAITIDMPMDTSDIVKPTIKMKIREHYLKDAINDAEFAVALNDYGVLNVGGVDLQLAVKEKDYVEDLRKKLVRWRELDRVLDKLHVTKAFDLTKITEEQSHQIDLLIDTVGRGNKVKLPGQQSTLLIMEISNLTLLLWCAVDKDDVCSIGDFFDNTIVLSYQVNEEKVNASLFSYLREEKFWERVDNIDFDNIVASAEKAAKGHVFCYQMSNFDVVAMISASDNTKESDPERSKMLLEKALELDEWLIDNDPQQGMRPMHVVNKLQIIKRQRELSESEKSVLEEMLGSEGQEDMIKVAVYLLLDRQDEAQAVFETLSEDDKKRFMEFPIWRFHEIHEASKL